MTIVVDAAGDIPPAETLDLVRYRLEALIRHRSESPLGDSEQATYQYLCNEELRLLRCGGLLDRS